MRATTLFISSFLLLGCASQQEPPPEPPGATPYCPEPQAADAEVEKPPEAPQGNVVTRNTPEVSDALRSRFARYLGVRHARLSSLAGDGKSLLVTTRFGSTTEAHRVTSPGGARTQLTFTEEPVRSVELVPRADGDLTYLGDIGGNEQYQIFRADKHGTVTLLTDGKSRHGGYVWSDQGDKLVFSSNARNGKDMDLYVGDGKSAEASRLLAEVNGYWAPVNISPDGERLLAINYVSINDSRLWVIDLESGEKKRVTPESPRAAYRAATFDKTGKKLFVATDRETDLVQLYEVDIASQSWAPLTPDTRWSVEALTLSPNGRTLAYTTNEDGYSVLHLLDTVSKRSRKAKNVPKGIIRNLRFAKVANTLGFSLQSPADTDDAYTYDPLIGRLTRWTHSETGGIDKGQFVEPELIRYKSFDDREIPAYVYRPPSPAQGAKLPVLIYIHGGPESQARPYFSAFTQYLVGQSGLAVIVPNVRGSDGYGKEYLLLDNGLKREDSVKDIGALLDWVASQPNLDASRVGVYGGSYGGYMVLASLVHFGSRIVAGTSAVGISNFVTFLKNTKSYRRDLRRAEYGDEQKPEMRAFLQKISPSTNAQKIQSELFVAHGANDPRVPLSETDQIVAAVEKSGKKPWYLVFNNEGHGFRKRENRDLFYMLSVMFFEQHLGVRR